MKNLNVITSNNLHKSRRITFDTSVNAVMYLRRDFSPATTLGRRRWSRRKHLHNWLMASNILKDWARSYRFYRNYNRSVFYQFFSKNSFLALNLATTTNVLPSGVKETESLIMSSFSKRLLNYFQKVQLTAAASLTFFSNASFINCSPLLPNIDSTSIAPNPVLVPILQSFPEQLTHFLETRHLTSPTLLRTLNALSLFTSKLHLSQIVTIYKILVLLTYTRSFVFNSKICNI